MKTLPKCLFIAIERVDHSMTNNRIHLTKNPNHVTFDDELQINQEWCCSNISGTYNLSLSAVIVHEFLGDAENVNCGHYFTYVKRFEKWYICE